MPCFARLGAIWHLMEADMKLGRILAASLLGAGLLASSGAYADPPHCPPGHAKKGWCTPGQPGVTGHVRRDHDRWDADDTRAYDRGYRDGLRDALTVGDRLPRDRYRIVSDYDRFGWPDPTDGRIYVEADDSYYLINLATGLILDVLTR